MSRCERDGITRLEVLVLLAIALILVGMLLPAARMGGPSYSGYRTECANNLRNIILAILNYQESNGSLIPSPTPRPADQAFPTGCFGAGARPEERLSWMVAILPYVEQENLYLQFDPKKAYADNAVAANNRIKLFRCPSADDAATPANATHYFALSGVGRGAASQPAGATGNGFMGYDRRTSLKMFEDGAAQTIAITETRTTNGPWAQGGPSNIRGFDPTHLPLFGDRGQFGGHPSACNVMMADGSMRRIPYSLNTKQLAAAITIAGKDEFDLD